MYEYQFYNDDLSGFVVDEATAIHKNKKKLPQWMFTMIISALATVIILIIFSYFIFPILKGQTIIHYSSESNYADSTVEHNQGQLTGTAAKCAPSSVYISSTGIVGGFFNQQISLGSGTGVIVSDNGYIITSSTVVNSGTEISVTLADGQKINAMLVGSDDKIDIAVLKIEAEGLVPAVLGDSENVNIGDEILTIGNPLGPQITNTVTEGIIAGVNNNVTLRNGTTLNLLQTDAKVSAGNTGGALFNLNGEVIGIIIGNISSDSGIALSIPVNDIKPLLSSFLGNEIQNGTNIDVSNTPMLGITGTGETYGVVVESVSENYPAAKAGLQKGDVIIKADGIPVTTVAAINEIRMKHDRGEAIVLTVFRNGETFEISVVLE